jgi:hypothetical protein
MKGLSQKLVALSTVMRAFGEAKDLPLDKTRFFTPGKAGIKIRSA